MKEIEVTVQEDAVSINLTGDLDGSCCAPEANLLNQELEALGLDLQWRGVHCRLPAPERAQAKATGECNSDPDKVEKEQGGQNE